MILRLILFLIINAAALALGSYFTGSIPDNDWYQSLNKAPWTPPGWVFGAAWTTIMICFSVFLAQYFGMLTDAEKRNFYGLFALQWILNVLWNPVFFNWQMVVTGLVVITVLWFLVGWFMRDGIRKTGAWGWLVLPYFLWLIVAASLNGYVLLYN